MQVYTAIRNSKNRQYLNISEQCYSTRDGDLGIYSLATARENFARALQFLTSRYGAQIELAKACKVTASSVSRWVAGQSQPSWEQMDAIAKFFRVPVTFFFEDVAENSTLKYEAAYRRLGELLPKSKKS